MLFNNEKCYKNVNGEIGWDDMNWTNLAQDRDWWRALVNEERAFGFHSGKLCSNCTTSCLLKIIQFDVVIYVLHKANIFKNFWADLIWVSLCFLHIDVVLPQ
jgi:hypothetical protein